MHRAINAIQYYRVSQILSRTLNFGLLICLLLMNAASGQAADQEQPAYDKLAFIAAEDGRDAIFLRINGLIHTIFNCEYENEIILTPSVSADGEYITFVVDNGRNERALHLLGPIKERKGKWFAADKIVLMTRGGAWPLYAGNDSFYLTLPFDATMQVTSLPNVYSLQNDELTQITDNSGNSKHILPLLAPRGDFLVYRELLTTVQSDDEVQGPQSIMLNLKTGESEAHFVHQSIFMEQWASNNEILISTGSGQQGGTRIYSLYDPAFKNSREIYRNVCRQGSISEDMRYLATIRSVPAGSGQYDIIVTDLESTQEVNITQSTNQSESLIGWLK